MLRSASVKKRARVTLRAMARPQPHRPALFPGRVEQLYGTEDIKK
jgi:hypothetical protein